jgi:rSAM/selenodomain-associated transferase 1
MSNRSAPRSDARLIVMAKYPEPGRVKTRLATTLGDEPVCALYRAFVLDLADRLARLPYEVIWAYDPAPAPFATLLPGARCVAQVEGDLGARMAHAVAAAFDERPGPVMVLGADVPHVSAGCLEEAAAVAAGRVVLGPAEDGGYYLIALARPAPELFADVPWGGDGVLRATQDRARRLGLETHLLPVTFDVDEAGDVGRLRALLETGAVALPRTAAVLASLHP